MPAEYTIDKLSGGVFSSAYGIITDQDAYSHQDRLRNDPEFNPGYFQLFDFTKVTQADISTEAIHLLAERNPFGQGSHRAFVVPSDLMYGLSRMFQILTDHHQDKLSIFKDIHEARKYLSLE